jgi:hypothetical protein
MLPSLVEVGFVEVITAALLKERIVASGQLLRHRAVGEPWQHRGDPCRPRLGCHRYTRSEKPRAGAQPLLRPLRIEYVRTLGIIGVFDQEYGWQQIERNVRAPGNERRIGGVDRVTAAARAQRSERPVGDRANRIASFSADECFSARHETQHLAVR